MEERFKADRGFTLVELMAVVFIIGVLVAMAIPMYISTTAHARKNTCFENQRILEGAVGTWLALGDGRTEADVIGLVNAVNPIVKDHIVGKPPRCPSGEKPLDPSNPSVAEGAYVFLGNGTLEPCARGSLGEHGHYGK